MKKAKPKSKSKTKKKSTPAIKKPEGKLIGKVSHYFDHIKVGVVKLTGPLSKGDEVRIIGGQDTDFSQEITSMQVEHEEVKKAKKGNSIGLKVKKKVREGYRVYKI